MTPSPEPKTQISPAVDNNKTGSGWRHALAEYVEPRVLIILPLGFASGLPLLLTFSTLSAWLATAGVTRSGLASFGAFKI